MYRLMFAICFFMTIACRNDLLNSPSAIFASDDIHILAENADGCRSPDEPGCDKCGIREGDKCYYQTGAGPFDDVDPWYSETGIDEGCVLDAPKCAKCSKRDEEELRALADKPVCDCTSSSVESGIDECVEPGSCACFCQKFEDLYARCAQSN